MNTTAIQQTFDPLHRCPAFSGLSTHLRALIVRINHLLLRCLTMLKLTCQKLRLDILEQFGQFSYAPSPTLSCNLNSQRLAQIIPALQEPLIQSFLRNHLTQGTCYGESMYLLLHANEVGEKGLQNPQLLEEGCDCIQELQLCNTLLSISSIPREQSLLRRLIQRVPPPPPLSISIEQKQQLTGHLQHIVSHTTHCLSSTTNYLSKHLSQLEPALNATLLRPGAYVLGFAPKNEVGHALFIKRFADVTVVYDPGVSRWYRYADQATAIHAIATLALDYLTCCRPAWSTGPEDEDTFELTWPIVTDGTTGTVKAGNGHSAHSKAWCE